MLSSAQRIGRLLRRTTPRHQPGATSTYLIVIVSSRPTWCAARSSQPDTSGHGSPRSSRSLCSTTDTHTALAR